MLLPGNASPIEVALDKAGEHRISGIPVPISDLWNPWTCPAHLLPHLAWALSVDIWREDWPEQKRRSVIARSVELHRSKGSISGHRKHLDLVDAQLRKIHRPPQRFFAGSSVTDEQYLAWLEKLPRLRIFRDFSRRVSPFRLFAGSQIRPQFLNDRFAMASKAPQATRLQCVLVQDGVETPVGVGDNPLTGEKQVYLREAAGQRYMAGRAAKMFARPSTAQTRVIRITTSEGMDGRRLRPVKPGNYLQQPALRRLSYRVVSGPFWFAGRHTRRFAGTSRAYSRIYEEVYLHDGSVAGNPYGVQSFANITRLGHPAHTLELQTHKTGRATGSAVFAGRFPGGYAHYHDKSRIKDMVQACFVAKRGTSKVLLNLSNYGSVRAGDTIYAGSEWIAGRMRKI